MAQHPKWISQHYHSITVTLGLPNGLKFRGVQEDTGEEIFTKSFDTVYWLHELIDLPSSYRKHPRRASEPWHARIMLYTWVVTLPRLLSTKSSHDYVSSSNVFFLPHRNTNRGHVNKTFTFYLTLTKLSVLVTIKIGCPLELIPWLGTWAMRWPSAVLYGVG